MATGSIRLRWGHVNINVRDLERSIAFYELLGFSMAIPGIPYLGLSAGEQARALPEACAEVLGIGGQVLGRACIMQLDDGFPKLDLTEFSGVPARDPLENSDLGCVRICLGSEDLRADHAHLSEHGVHFLTPPRGAHGELADIAVCADPDGTLIELIQLHLDRWPRNPGG